MSECKDESRAKLWDIVSTTEAVNCGTKSCVNVYSEFVIIQFLLSRKGKVESLPSNHGVCCPIIGQ